MSRGLVVDHLLTSFFLCAAEQGYNSSTAAGFYGAYYPAPPPRVAPANANIARWGGQYYGNGSGQYNPVADGSSGFGYGGY